MREVCGTVCGAAMLAGMVYGATDGKDREAKALTYKKVQEIVEIFKQTNHSVVCRELLGLSGSAPTPLYRRREPKSIIKNALVCRLLKTRQKPRKPCYSPKNRSDHMEYPNTVFIESRQGTIAIGNRYIVRVFLWTRSDIFARNLSVTAA